MSGERRWLWMVLPMFVNRAHKIECVNAAFLLAKEACKQRSENLRKQSVNAEMWIWATKFGSKNTSPVPTANISSLTWEWGDKWNHSHWSSHADCHWGFALSSRRSPSCVCLTWCCAVVWMVPGRFYERDLSSWRVGEQLCRFAWDFIIWLAHRLSDVLQRVKEGRPWWSVLGNTGELPLCGLAAPRDLHLKQHCMPADGEVIGCTTVAQASSGRFLPAKVWKHTCFCPSSDIRPHKLIARATLVYAPSQNPMF